MLHCRENKHRNTKKALCDPDSLFLDRTIHGRARSIELDFYLPNFNLAFEFDERQHFTDERKTSISAYPDWNFPSDRTRWYALCSQGVVDPEPPYRDWRRAFRDSIRDLRCFSNGVPLLRIYYEDLPDLNVPKIEALISSAKVKS